MQAGFSLDELGRLPLRTWAALYRAVQAQRLEDAALSLGVVHARNPKQTRDRLLRAAREVLSDKPLATDPQRLRRTLLAVGSVGIEDKDKDGIGR